MLTPDMLRISKICKKFYMVGGSSSSECKWLPMQWIEMNFVWEGLILVLILHESELVPFATLSYV
jgi:hypothetical protein